MKCEGTRAETRFRLSVKRTNPFKSTGGVSSFDYWQTSCAASAVVMLHTPCSEVVWRVLATHSICEFPLHFPSRASPCAITFQLESNTVEEIKCCSYWDISRDRPSAEWCSVAVITISRHVRNQVLLVFWNWFNLQHTPTSGYSIKRTRVPPALAHPRVLRLISVWLGLM